MDGQNLKVRRISHYSSDMDILLVGEGDFSFAAALASAFHYAPRLFATSLDSREMLHIKYGKLIMEQRLNELAAKGVVVKNEVDLKTILQNPSVCHLSLDCIVYNFPHSGFCGPGDYETENFMIRKHRRLMQAFFKSASRLLKAGGEVHVVHHTCKPYSEWRLEEEAAKSGLKLRTCRPFKAKAFAGYVSRRGAGKNAHCTFRLQNPVTFIFSLPESSPPLQKFPSSLECRPPASQPPPSIIPLRLSAHTVPLHSSSPHTNHFSSQRRPPLLQCKAQSSTISIPCPVSVIPPPPPRCTIYSQPPPPLPDISPRPLPQDPYIKLSRPPATVSYLDLDDCYRLLGSNDHIKWEVDDQTKSESTSCTSFLMWMICCCTSSKADTLS